MNSAAFQRNSPAGPDRQTDPKSNPPPIATEAVSCCAWCSLPVRSLFQSPKKRPTTKPGEPDGPDAVYCCFGCRIAHAIAEERGQSGQVRGTVVRLGLAVFFTMNLMAFTMISWSPDVYGAAAEGTGRRLLEAFRWLSMLLSLPVLLLLGIPLLHNAVISLKQRIYSTDLLIALGVAAAYLVSAWNVVHGSGAVYFEVGAAVLVMVTVGRWLEAAGRQKATESLEGLASLLPETARRADTESGEPIRCDQIRCDQIVIGDLLQIRPGERFPTDGRIVAGRTTVDEQIFTGECLPIARTTGDPVLGGTVNLDGQIVVEATAPFRGGSFGRLIELLQTARLSRGQYQLLADRTAAWFLPAVVVIAAMTLLWHLRSGFGIAIQHSLSVLLIACPCALGLATPLAVWTALSTAIRRQVLFRNGEALERLAEIQAVCFDKTGTLTTGMPQVRIACVLNSQCEAEVFAQAAALANSSTHPFSQAIVRYAERLPVSENCPAGKSTAVELTEIRSIPGRGVEAMRADHRRIRLGSIEFAFGEANFAPSRRMMLARILATADQEAASIVALSVADQPVAVFALTETLRADAPQAVRQCADLGLSLTILTGDRGSRAEQLCESLQSAASDSLSAPIPLTIECELQPHQKIDSLIRLRKRLGGVAMVGDGINDAPVLAASDAGIAMGCGADVCRDSASICLLTSELDRIPWAVQLARRTRSVIRQNLVWAFGYNAVGVAFAAAGLLNPVIAAALMIASSLLVITNSLRLLADHADERKLA